VAWDTHNVWGRKWKCKGDSFLFCHWVRNGLSDNNKRLKHWNIVLWACVQTKKGAPYEEFEKISLKTGGVARQLFTDSDTAQQLTGFYSEMAIPVIHNFECSYKNTKKGKTLCSDSTLFRGQELFSIGEIENCGTKPQLIVDENNVLADSEILGRFYFKDSVK